MAAPFLANAVADLTLGKPALFWLPSTASVRDALRALKHLADDVSEISVWECVCDGSRRDYAREIGGHGSHKLPAYTGPPASPLKWRCRCVGKICVQSILCYLASKERLCNLADALQAPVLTLLSDEYPDGSVQLIDPETSLLEALQLIAGGAQNLIVPIKCAGRFSKACHFEKPLATKKVSNLSQRSHGDHSICWLTHEDVLRFLLGSIGSFSPLSMMSIQDLGIVQTDIYMIRADEEVASGLELIKGACAEGSAVAVVEEREDMLGAYTLVGDISSTTLQGCSETVALAMATLPAGAFVMYAQDCRHSTDGLLNLILRTQLHEKIIRSNIDGHANEELLKLGELFTSLQDCDSWEESSSDGEESGADSPTGPLDYRRQNGLSPHWRISGRTGFSLKGRSGPIFCSPKNSLVAVLLQALANREHYVWVIGEDGTLLGIVTFSDILAGIGNLVNTI